MSLATPAGGHGATDAAVMTLSVAGKPRSLQGPILGGSTSAFFEHFLDNPAKIAALSKMAIGLDRFPGGSDANFYNWRTRLIEIKAYPDSSPYVRFWAKAAANIARGMPDGVTMEQYAHFSGQIGAEVILVPNLESSGVADQVEWFKHLSGKGLVPQKIELGNEFWVAMGNDSRSLARWPDAPSTIRTMKQYLEALKPYMPPNAKIAVQAAASGFNVHRNPRALFWQRIDRWDDDLRPEPWFDAVTLHLYPRLSEVMGDPLAGITLPTRENAMPRLKAMMAQVDEGTEGVLAAHGTAPAGQRDLDHRVELARGQCGYPARRRCRAGFPRDGDAPHRAHGPRSPAPPFRHRLAVLHVRFQTTESILPVRP